VSPIAIDVGIGDTIQAVNGILTRRESERATVWDSLAYQLEAVAFAVGELDRMYFALLAEIENVFEDHKPSHERIEDVIAQATTYCTDGRLVLRLNEWRGEIESAAFNHALKHRRYRTLASTLRSINDPLGRYIKRLYALQDVSSASVRDLVLPVEVGDGPESLPGDRKWDLRTVLGLVKSISFQLSEDKFSDGSVSLREACEQAIRNYDRALSLTLVNLIGHARQDLSMERL
jgi:hypothetical protein